MSTVKKVLYISYDGLTDPLGQSQIIPYLEGLSQAGHRIFVVSAEKRKRFAQNKELIEQKLSASSISWYPVFYTKFPPVLSTLYDIYKIKRFSRNLYRQYGIEVVHCRSYISAIIGLWMKKKYGLRFIFDMRGLWADERVEGNIWNLSNPLFRWVYRYFKTKERQFLIHADSVVSLTHSGADEITHRIATQLIPEKITVIPCCADLNHFSPQNADETNIKEWRKKLQIRPSSFVLGYLGSIGTWYLLPEMVAFFRVLNKNYRNDAVFLFVTMESPIPIYDEFRRQNIDTALLRVLPARRNELPDLLSLFDASVSFIKPSYSKKASSPTKLGELLGMGIPVFSNTGVGDIDLYYRSVPFLKVDELNEEQYQQCWEAFFRGYPYQKQTFVSLSHQFFSLHEGTTRYIKIYNSL